MNGSLRNLDASSSEAQPVQPSADMMSRYCANSPSWNERCLNWYCAAEVSVCASSVFVSGIPASSLSKCSHMVNASALGISRSSVFET